MTYEEYLDIGMIPGLFAVLCILVFFLVLGIRFLLRLRFRRRMPRTSRPARAFGKVLRNSGAPFWKRKAATQALGTMNTPGAVEELLTFFEPRAVAEDGKITSAVIKALGMTKSPRVVECLKGYLMRLIVLCKNPTQPYAGMALKRELISKTGKPAIRALAKINDPSAISVLKQALEVKVLSRRAKKALRKIGDDFPR